MLMFSYVSLRYAPSGPIENKPSLMQVMVDGWHICIKRDFFH